MSSRHQSARFVKHQDFLYNTAGAHGGAIATQFALIEYIPEDATYEGNSRTNVSMYSQQMGVTS